MKRSDNTLRGANNLGNLTSSSLDSNSNFTNTRNKLNRKDSDDLFRFTLGRSQLVSIEALATKNSADLDIELYEFKRPKRKVLRAIGQEDWSDLKRRDIRRNLQRLGRSKDGNVAEFIEADIPRYKSTTNIFHEIDEKWSFETFE